MSLPPATTADGEDRVPLEVSLESVTVYSDRAQLTYTATQRFAAGSHVLVMEGRGGWDRMDRSTVQVRLDNAESSPAMLRNVGFVTRHVEEDVRDEVQKLRKQLEHVEDELGDVQDQIDTMEEVATNVQRVAPLLAHGATPAADGARAPPDAHAAAYFQDPQRWYEIAKFVAGTRRRCGEQRIALDEKKDELEEEKARIEAELFGLTGYQNPPPHITPLARMKEQSSIEATVDLPADLQGDVELRLRISFVAYGAGWKPLYDLRVQSAEESGKASVEISYYAEVAQHTGLDWDHVRVRLSTAMPHFGSSPPSLGGRWRISLKNPAVPKLHRNRMAEKRCMAARGGPGAFGGAAAPMVEEALVDAPSASGVSATAFDIVGLATVPSNNKAVKLTIARRSVEATLSYMCVPKIDPMSCLAASAINTTPFELLPGKAAVFYGSTFVSHTNLSSVIPPGAALKLSLGTDPIVVTTRQQVKRLESVQKCLLQKPNKVVEFVYAYEARSSSQVPIEVKVMDHYPVSSDTSVAVSRLEPVGAGMQEVGFTEDENRKVEWVLKLKPHERRLFRLSFCVKYPSDVEVFGLDD